MRTLISFTGYVGVREISSGRILDGIAWWELRIVSRNFYLKRENGLTLRRTSCFLFLKLPLTLTRGSVFFFFFDTRVEETRALYGKYSKFSFGIFAYRVLKL